MNTAAETSTRLLDTLTPGRRWTVTARAPTLDAILFVILAVSAFFLSSLCSHFVYLRVAFCCCCCFYCCFLVVNNSLSSRKQKQNKTKNKNQMIVVLCFYSIFVRLLLHHLCVLLIHPRLAFTHFVVVVVVSLLLPTHSFVYNINLVLLFALSSFLLLVGFFTCSSCSSSSCLLAFRHTNSTRNMFLFEHNLQQQQPQQ